MTLDVTDGATSCGVRDKHPSQEIPSIGTNGWGEDKGRGEDVLVELIDVITIRICRVIIIGEVTSEHGVEDDTTGPDIDSGTHVLSIRDDEFRGSVARRTTGGVHEVTLTGGFVKLIRKAKISDNEIPSSVQEKVLQLEITMNDALCMKIRYTRDQLGKKATSILFLEVTMGKDMIKELPTWDE